MKQIFKGTTLTRTKVVNNILKVYNYANGFDAYDWYEDAHRWSAKTVSNSAELNETNLNKFVGIVAALSPMKHWNTNMRIAEKFYNGNAEGKQLHMKAFLKKAEDILNSSGDEEEILSILNGNKIKSFYLNIRYPDRCGQITIDRHALSVSLGRVASTEEQSGITEAQYGFFMHCYTHAAAKIGVTPQYLQGVTWTVWRRMKGIK